MADVRLIDANNVVTIQVFDEMTEEYDMQTMTIAEMIDRWADEGCPPTIDAVPVVHSSWGYRAYRSDARITVSGEAVCRKCHAPFFRVRGHWFKYCPNCGAKMDGVRNEQTDSDV